MATDVGSDRPANRLDERLFERCEALPERLPPGSYVVVDTMHFSNTVIELLANGADHVHVAAERGLEFDYRASNPGTLVGGEATAGYEPAPGYDFINSPSYVQQLHVGGRPVSMTSTNGGRTVTTLRERAGEQSEVYVGSPLNAKPLARHLRDRDGDRPVHLVSAGTRGDIAVEDHVGATLVSRYLDGLPPSETERLLFRRQLRTAKGPDYVEGHERRRRDVLDYAMNLNGREVVPRLVDGVLVDDATRQQSRAAGRRTD